MERIGRYKITGEIGRGAMGVVYSAQDPAIGRTVAIKTIRLSDLADSAERSKLHDRLFREAQSAGMLSHPGIVTIYDVAEEGDVAYIAMECVDGPTLDRLLVADPPDGALVLSILNQTAAALDYAHKRGIIHRDIKPANIIIHDRTTAKITDFGVAKIQSHQMTHAGGLIGTPNYMSPEQIQGEQVTGSSDQFSLGVIAYELLTGEKPFVADSMPTLVFKIVREDPAPVHRLNSSLGWAVDTVVKRALSKSPGDRYPTCSDFIFALENACRASKGWKPIAPGASTDLPTIVPTAQTPLRQQPAASAAPPQRGLPTFDRAERENVPTLLRIGRVLAVVILCGALIPALLLGALEYFSYDAGESAAVKDETQQPRPDQPTPEPRPERPTFLPGDPSPETKPSPEPAEKAAAEPDEPPMPATSPSLNASREPAPLRLVTNPPGAFLVIDGSSVSSCTSPCSLTLGPGRHTLAATKPGYRRTLRIFETPGNGEIFVNLDQITGTLAVRSDPVGAAVYINGQLQREKTPAVITLPVGSYSIEVVKDGQRQKNQAEVKDSMITNLAVDLQP